VDEIAYNTAELMIALEAKDLGSGGALRKSTDVWRGLPMGVHAVHPAAQEKLKI